MKTKKETNKPKTMKTNEMKNYEVTLLLVVNPSRDIDLEHPQVKRVEYIVAASSEDEARVKAKELETSGLSVWESWANENYNLDEIVEKHNALVDKFEELSKSHEEMTTKLEKIEKSQRHLKINLH